MGRFIVTVDAVGNHGCQRDKKDGEVVIGCESTHCTDCITREFVRRLKRAGSQVSLARIEHWPTYQVAEAAGQVNEDLLSGIRSGSFS